MVVGRRLEGTKWRLRRRSTSNQQENDSWLSVESA